ncbi:MAG: hypothetical protein JNM27_20985 [Leptospirales bacterium]|nr:hypothetical protein [Leptospirales bacterium]
MGRLLFLLLSLVASVAVSSESTSGWRATSDRSNIVQIAYDENRLYAIEEIEGPGAAADEIYLNVLSLANPDRPTFLGKVSLPRSVQTVYASRGRVFIMLREESFGSGKSALLVYDVRNPKAVRLAYEFSWEEIARVTLPQRVDARIQVAGQRLYIGGANGLLVYDDTGVRPKLSRVIEGKISDFAVLGTRIFYTLTMNDEHRLSIEDVTPSKIGRLGTLALPGLCCSELRIRGNFVYLLDREMRESMAIDVTSVAAPQIVHRGSTDVLGEFVPSDDMTMLYTASGYEDLLIARVKYEKGKTSLVQGSTSLRVPPHGFSLIVARSRLYVAAGKLGVVVRALKT